MGVLTMRNTISNKLFIYIYIYFFTLTGFDSTPSQSATDTVQKVKKIVSKLVEESFGESIDVVSTKILTQNIDLS